jgi:CheY-like chemotaxis protein
MDCNMPFMDGYEATNNIRELIKQSNLKQPIIVAITGHTDHQFLIKAIDSGMNQVLSKPVNIEVLK